MNQFFGTQYSQEDLQRHVAQRRNQHSRRQSGIVMPPLQSHDDMDLSGMVGGDSLDDIIMQNSKELQRRQSMPSQYSTDTLDQDPHRRATLMDFGTNTNSLTDFQYSMQDAVNGNHEHNRRQSMDDLDMSPTFVDMTGAIGPSAMGMRMPPASYIGPMHPNQLTIDTTGSYTGLPTDMMSEMMSYSNEGMSSLSGDTPTNMFTAANFANPFSATSMGPIPSEYPMNMDTPEDPMSGTLSGSSNDQQSLAQSSLGQDNTENDMMTAVPGLRISETSNSTGSRNMNMNQSLVGYTSPPRPGASRKRSNDDAFLPDSTPVTEASPGATLPQAPPSKSTYQNIYSSSGFDMLRALMQVATRKNPEIDIGAVDMSCAFVVCDVTQSDCPIIYVSEIFERLTGYNKHEVLGRNCRFLQDPEGKVVPGSKRPHVDDESVYYLKMRINARKEAQRSLINYRKGGQPFMNLLTMIPITWDTDEVKYFVGFQVDLVEQPSAIASKNAGGSYTVNYSQGTLPPYVWSPPTAVQQQRDSGQTISPDDVTALLIAFKNNNAESELSKRMWDKVLLENTDDVVHVLSLKGLFLYLSPSSQKVLEYDPSELVGTALSSVCHPSDIVPVTRELKDTSTGAAVNIVFRIRRKRSGYTWFESHGSLCVEQGKGRKCLILVGRERPVYALSRHDIEAAGGIGDNEIWTKLSTSGMILFVSSNVRLLLDRQSDELIGTSMQVLMRPESKVEFGRSLEKARTGKQLIYKHEIMNKRGQIFQAQTTIYPGDASEGQKPTFLVGQTRLLKPSSRAVAPAASARSGVKSMSTMSNQGVSDESVPATQSSPNSGSGVTPRSVTSILNRESVMTQAGGVGLAIGTQDIALASEDNIFDELKTTRCTSWQFELRQMERNNRLLTEELAGLVAAKRKRKRRKGVGHLQQDCANCHVKTTPEWRRGPSGKRDLCNSCGLRWAKQVSQGNSDSNSTKWQRATASSGSSSGRS
jgi:PAS domain S-box-containing protein